jgi:hypothetical protein
VSSAGGDGAAVSLGVSLGVSLAEGDSDGVSETDSLADGVSLAGGGVESGSSPPHPALVASRAATASCASRRTEGVGKGMRSP